MERRVRRASYRLKPQDMPPQDHIKKMYQEKNITPEDGESLLFTLPEQEGVHLINPLSPHHRNVALCALRDVESLKFEHGLLRIYVHKSHLMNVQKKNWRTLENGVQRLLSGLNKDQDGAERAFRIEMRSFETPPVSFDLDDDPFSSQPVRFDGDVLPAEFSILIPSPEQNMKLGLRLARFHIDFVPLGTVGPLDLEQKGIYTNSVFEVDLQDSIKCMNLMFRTIGQIIRYKRFFHIDRDFGRVPEKEMGHEFIHEFTVRTCPGRFSFLDTESLVARGFQSEPFEDGSGTIVTRSQNTSRIDDLVVRFEQQRGFNRPTLKLKPSTRNEIQQARTMCEEFRNYWNSLLYVSMRICGNELSEITYTNKKGRQVKINWDDVRYYSYWIEEINRTLNGTIQHDTPALHEILRGDVFQDRAIRGYCMHVFGEGGPVHHRDRAENVLKWFRSHAEAIDCVYKSTHYASHSKMGKDGESFEFAFSFSRPAKDGVSDEEAQIEELVHLYAAGVDDLEELDLYFFWKFYSMLLQLVEQPLGADILLLERRGDKT